MESVESIEDLLDINCGCKEESILIKEGFHC